MTQPPATQGFKPLQLIMLLLIAAAVFVPLRMCAKQSGEKPLETIGSKRADTAWILDELRRAIAQYALKNNRLPENLRELPVVYAGKVPVEDQYENPIRYKIEPDGMIELASYGRDGIEGGTRSSRDIVGKFRPKMGNGNWDPNPRWVQEPMRFTPSDD